MKKMKKEARTRKQVKNVNNRANIKTGIKTSVISEIPEIKRETIWTKDWKEVSMVRIFPGQKQVFKVLVYQNGLADDGSRRGMRVKRFYVERVKLYSKFHYYLNLGERRERFDYREVGEVERGDFYPLKVSLVRETFTVSNKKYTSYVLYMLV